MSATGAVYEVLTGLRAVFSRVVSPGQVFLGMPEDVQWQGQTVAFVAHPQGDGPAVTLQSEPSQFDGTQRIRMSVECALAVGDGGKDAAATLKRLDDVERRLRAALNGDRTLGGVAENVEFGEGMNIEMDRASGVRWLALFTVGVVTWSRPA